MPASPWPFCRRFCSPLDKLFSLFIPALFWGLLRCGLLTLHTLHAPLRLHIGTATLRTRTVVLPRRLTALAVERLKVAVDRQMQELPRSGHREATQPLVSARREGAATCYVASQCGHTILVESFQPSHCSAIVSSSSNAVSPPRSTDFLLLFGSLFGRCHGGLSIQTKTGAH